MCAEKHRIIKSSGANSIVDKVYNYLVYRKIMHDIEQIEFYIINSDSWRDYGNRCIYRQCMQLEIAVDTMYKSGFDNFLLAHILQQIYKLQHAKKV